MRGIAEGPKRAAGYIRVSQVGGREGDGFLSPELQREKIEAWAAYRGYDVTAWYVDLDRSGRTGVHRPEFERMMAEAAEGRFEAVAVYRLTRFGRSVADAARRYEELRQLGVALVSVTEDIDTTTLAGNLLRNLLFALAEFESDRIGEEWRNVHAARRRKGIAHVARPMLGYRTQGAEIVGVEHSEAQAVRRIFQLRLQGHGYGAVRAILEREGYQPKGGGHRFATSSLRSILRNPLYAGLVRYGDELIEGTHEGIVSREQWEAVQAVGHRLDDLATFRASLLSGLLVCASCGSRLRHDVRSNGSPVYRCAASTSSSVTCERAVSIAASPLEGYVERTLLKNLRRQRSRMPHGGRLRRSSQQATWAKKATALRARAEELTQALDSLADQRFVKGTIEADEYRRQFARYAEEREDVTQEADDLDALAKNARPLDVDLLDQWSKYRLEDRRRVLRIAIARIIVGPGKPGGSPTRGIDTGRVSIEWQ